MEAAGGTLTRALSTNVFALIVDDVGPESEAVAFAIEYDVAVVTLDEAIEQIKDQLRSEGAIIDLTDAAPAGDDLPEVGLSEPGITVVPDNFVENDEMVVESDLAIEPEAARAGEHVGASADESFSSLEARVEPALRADTEIPQSQSVAVPAQPAVTPKAIPAGWYPVSGSEGDERYHDGTAWTAQFRSGDGDPLAAPLDFLGSAQNRTLLAVAGAAVVVVVGSIGPWANLGTAVGDVAVPGTDVDGTVTLIGGMASAGLLAGALVRRHRLAWIAGMLGFAAVMAVSLYELTNLDALVTDSSFASPSAGWGLWAVIAGAFAALVVGAGIRRSLPDSDN